MALRRAAYLAVSEAADPNDLREEWTITRRFRRRGGILANAATGEFEVVIINSLEELLSKIKPAPCCLATGAT